MTDDNEAAVQSATNATTTRVNGNPGGRGNPRGRNRCSGCGAEGVNILTCPGDGQPHEPTTEYREKLAQGPRPESQRVNPPGPAPQAVAQAMVAVLRDADETPVSRHLASIVRRTDRLALDQAIPVSRVTVRVVTAYPALAQASLEACVDDLAEAIWVGSHIQELT